MKNEIFSNLSEKVLPYKIKSIIWHKKIDIIVVLCDNYYEIHRIGFKHEDIYQKEEPCTIKQITFVEDTETISVLLENSFMYLLSCSNCEIIVQKKLSTIEVKHTLLPFQNYIGEGFTENTNKIDKKDLLSRNPFFIGLHFNSFSKIDISTLSFYHNFFEFNFSYLFDKHKNKIEVFLYNLINLSTIILPNQAVYSKCVLNDNILLLSAKENTNLQISLINLTDLFKNSVLITVFFYLSYSINILDYLNSITDIFQRLIYKIGIIFFDKFIFANKLENVVCSENEEDYKKQLKEELKYLFYTGIMKTNLTTLLKSDLFEGKTMIKMDENIFFNLRNLEDIYVENIKASLSVLSYYINEIKIVYHSTHGNKHNAFNQIESWFNQLTSKYENLINQMSNIKLDYRTFLAWLNTFNTTNPNENKNNYLHSVQIDEDKIWKFIEDESYNMTNIIKELEPANEKKMQEVSFMEDSDSNQEKLLSKLLDDDWSLSFFLDNKFNIQDCLKTKGNAEKRTLNNDNIKEIIVKIIESLEKVNQSFKDKTKDHIKYIDILSLKGYDINRIRKVKSFKDDGSSYLSFFYTSVVNNKDCDILVILKTVISQGKERSKNIAIHQTIVNFSYETTKIIDYDFQNKSLLILVKSLQNSNSNYTEKFSIIQSFLSNYNLKQIFSFEEGLNNTFGIDLQETILNSFNEKEVNDVIIDKYIDLDCSDSSFISCGQRGLFAVVDNRLNRLTIFDIYNN